MEPDVLTAATVKSSLVSTTSLPDIRSWISTGTMKGTNPLILLKPCLHTHSGRYGGNAATAIPGVRSFPLSLITRLVRTAKSAKKPSAAFAYQKATLMSLRSGTMKETGGFPRILYPQEAAWMPGGCVRRAILIGKESAAVFSKAPVLIAAGGL